MRCCGRGGWGGGGQCCDGESKVYRRAVDCDDTGQDLRLRPGRLHVLAVLLADLKGHESRQTHRTQVGAKNEAEWMKVHLVPGLDHLLRIGEKRHKLVWVLDLNGGAARLSQLLRLQPLEEGQAARMCYINAAEQKIYKI